MYKIISYLLLFTVLITDALKIGMGGKNRGSSAARMNSRTYQSHQGAYRPQQSVYHPQSSGHYPQRGNYYPQQSGYRQSAPVASHGNYHQQGGFVPNQMKPSGRGTFGKAFIGGALGAAAGLATFELGKAILRSNSEPLRMPNGQNYYFDERNHQPMNGYFMCSMPMDDVVKTLQESRITPMPGNDDSTNSTAMTPEQFFKTVQFTDGTRPKSLTWNCKANTEVCCGTDCCPAQPLQRQQIAVHGGSVHHGRPLSVIFTRFEKKNWLLRQTQSLQLYLLSSKESDYLLSDHYQYIGQQQYYQTV